MNKVLETIAPDNALEIYQCDKSEEIISRIESEARSIVPDLSTDKGRKAIASTARRVSTSKVALDNLGKDLVSDWKTKAKGVDAERKLIRDRLDALRDEIRQPLTDWEDAEKAKEQAEREAAELLYDHEQAISENTMFDRERELARKEAEQAKIEQDRLDKEASDKAEADRVAHDSRVAKEAAERAENEAAEKIKAAEEALKQAELEKIEFEQRAKIQAENAEREKEASIERERIRSENAEREKKDAVERAKQAEIDRQAEKQRKADAEQAKLEANKKHVGAIRKAAKESLISLGIGEETARKIVLAISHGKISNITINY